MTATIEAYLITLQTQDRSPATVRATRSDLSGFRAWWEKTYERPFTVQQLVTRDIRRWQVERQQVDGAKPSTINRAFLHYEVFANGVSMKACDLTIQYQALLKSLCPISPLKLSVTKRLMLCCGRRATAQTWCSADVIRQL